MKHITFTDPESGTDRVRAESGPHSHIGMGSVATQPAFRPVSRREIMAAVNTCSRDLGLRQGSVVVLDALLSCLPCRDSDGREVPVSPATLLTVYASNETLCFRAKGLTDRQLRRHLETLEAAGLICRRDSANGKRFPVMQHGKAIGAFGLDLSPLFAQGNELLAMALRRREEVEELRGLRAQILRLRAACADLVLDEPLATFVAELRNLVRRSTLTLLEARAALARLTAVFTNTNRSVAQDLEHPPIHSNAPIAALEPLHKPFVKAAEITAQTDKTPASDGQNVRHKEQESQTKKRKSPATPPLDWCELTELSDFFPKPDSPRMAATIAFEFGKMLRINQSTLVDAVNKLGLGELLKLEDRIAAQIDNIHNPDAYLRSLLRS